jgi:hypothetical protein
MNAYDIEAFAGMHIQHMPECLSLGSERVSGDLRVTRYVDAFAAEMGRFVNLRRRWVGGEDGGYDIVTWDRAMFIDEECRSEMGNHYARWIEFVEGIDPWAGHSDTPPDFDPFEQHYDGSSMEQQR